MPEGVIEETFTMDRVVIGRSKRSDLCCPHEGLSRSHCLVELIEEKIFITDLGSINGVYIDSNRIGPHVRHIYEHYNSLSIGPFECTIGNNEKKIIETIQEEKTKTQVSKLPPPPGKIKNAPPDRTYLKAIAPIFIFFIVSFYFLNTSNDTETTKIEIAEITRPAKLRPIPPTFKSTALYTEEESDKNCLNQLEKYCKKMNLNPEHEGFFQYKKDLTIYLKPSLYLSEPRYKGIKDERDALELIAMDKILSSPVMDDYFRNSNFQIHLVLKNDSNEIVTVARFHPEKYSARTVQRMDALHLLESAITGVSTSELFWRHIHAYIPEIGNRIE